MTQWAEWDGWLGLLLLVCLREIGIRIDRINLIATLLSWRALGASSSPVEAQSPKAAQTDCPIQRPRLPVAYCAPAGPASSDMGRLARALGRDETRGGAVGRAWLGGHREWTVVVVSVPGSTGDLDPDFHLQADLTSHIVSEEEATCCTTLEPARMSHTHTSSTSSCVPLHAHDARGNREEKPG
jgi:hypothetical protein